MQPGSCRRAGSGRPAGHRGRHLIRRYVSPAAALLLLASGCAPHRNLAALETMLTRQDSATVALGQWCAARRMADPARVVAETLPGPPASLPRGGIAALALPASEPPGYRHVRLSCGGVVLSEAHNWFAASRLAPGMAETLATTRTPFGTVVAPLNFRRERLSARRGRAPGCPAGTVLSHRARLVLPDGRPLALLVECYLKNALKAEPGPAGNPASPHLK